MYSRPEDFDMLPIKAQDAWDNWVNQESMIGFNSGKYNINMIKRQIAQDESEKIVVARKDNGYMFLTTSKLSSARDEL